MSKPTWKAKLALNSTLSNPAAVSAIPVQQPQRQPLDRLVSNYNSYPNLSYAVQNCNSLNISTVCNKQLTKIIAITALCTDIIFLSDLRLNSNEENVEKVKKLLLYNSTHSYDAHFHSTKNKRGVGILIFKRLSYTIEKTYKDEDENIQGAEAISVKYTRIRKKQHSTVNNDQILLILKK
jgi:hypothetical protein